MGLSKHSDFFSLVILLITFSGPKNALSESSTVATDQDNTTPQMTEFSESSNQNTNKQAGNNSGAQSEDTTNSSEHAVTSPEVTIPQGTVRGLKFVTLHNRSISGFLGIPYAKPPIGNLRFKSPVAADAWNGTLDATSDQNVCPQLSPTNVVIGDEDCLYLNVFTPQIPTEEVAKSFAVMVFIHGGGFENGSGSSSQYGPEYLLDKDVVLVTPNYRLGVLGFLSTGDEVAPGNYGLKDLVLALKWVQNNVVHFGGNADEVTIFGQSAGAGAVELLSLSNSTKGLFHRYITESGSALSIRSFRPRKVYQSRSTELGGYLGCPQDSSTELIDCLTKLNATQIVGTKTLFYKWRNFPNLVWGPTNEPDTDEAILTETPTKLYATKQVSDLPWIAGVVKNEGSILSLQFYTNPELFDEFLKKFDEVLPYVLQYHGMYENEQDFTQALKSYYFNDLNADRKVLLSNLTDLIGDAMMTYPIYSGLQKRLAYANDVEYFYSFQYGGNCSYGYKYSDGSIGNYSAAHGDELLYLFPHPDPILTELCGEKSKTDYKIVDDMVQMWTSFAINGTPSVSNIKSTRGWTPHKRNNDYLMIGNDQDADLKMHYFFLSNRMHFWKNLNGTTSHEKNTIGSWVSYFIGRIWGIIAHIVRPIIDAVFFWV